MAVRRKKLAVAALAIAVLLAHTAAIDWLAAQWRPPTLPPLAKPMYTRQITPQAPPTQKLASNVPPAPVSPARPAIIKIAKSTAAEQLPARPPRKRAIKPDEPLSEPVTEALEIPAAPPPPPGEPTASEEAASARSQVAETAAPPPQEPAMSPSDPLADWPTDTRLRYELSGYYFGELHGSAQVLWQRDESEYEAVIEIDLGVLAYLKLTSRGRITRQGLAPRYYEELQRTRRRGVRLEDEAIVLDGGTRIGRPPQVQDTASQFVELAHRFATGRVPLAAGQTIALWLARPGGVDRWTFDVAGKVTLPTPMLGAVEAYHLKPQRLVRLGGTYSAEIWFAPSLQYLPVKIRVTMGDSAWVDLVVKRIDQR